jgi:hypothetical protein
MGEEWAGLHPIAEANPSGRQNGWPPLHEFGFFLLSSRNYERPSEINASIFRTGERFHSKQKICTFVKILSPHSFIRN